jgi:hypothetical protein
MNPLILAAVSALSLTAAADEGAAPPAPPAVEAPVTPSITPPSDHYFGINIAANIALFSIDAQVGHFYAFAAGNLGVPLLTNGNGGGFAVGAGYTRAISDPAESMWYFDVFAMATPGWFDAFKRPVVGLGAGVGFRYLHRSGFTFELKAPVFGLAVGPGVNANYDGGTGEMMSKFYLGSLIGLPIASFGYRF